MTLTLSVFVDGTLNPILFSFQAFLLHHSPPLIDPTSQEASLSRALLSLSSIPALGTVTDVRFEGQATREQVKEVKTRPYLPSRLIVLDVDFWRPCAQALGTLKDVAAKVHGIAVKALTDAAERRQR
jgi:hypothetical protein